MADAMVVLLAEILAEPPEAFKVVEGGAIAEQVLRPRCEILTLLTSLQPQGHEIADVGNQAIALLGDVGLWDATRGEQEPDRVRAAAQAARPLVAQSKCKMVRLQLEGLEVTELPNTLAPLPPPI